MIAPLRQMAMILDEIRVGSFLPSGTRAGMFPGDDGETVTDIKQRYYARMQEITNQRVADEVGSDTSSERRFSDLSDYEADRAEQEPDEVPDFGEIVSIADEEDSPKPDRNDEQPPVGENMAFFEELEDELGIREGSTLNIAAVATASQLEPDRDSDKESSESSSSSSSNSSSVNSKTFEVLLREPIEDASPCARDIPVVENLFKVRGGKYHIGSANSESHFICGAKITPRASRQVTSPAFFSPKCPKCFKA